MAISRRQVSLGGGVAGSGVGDRLLVSGDHMWSTTAKQIDATRRPTLVQKTEKLMMRISRLTAPDLAQDRNSNRIRTREAEIAPRSTTVDR